jgi:hypothetical protein
VITSKRNEAFDNPPDKMNKNEIVREYAIVTRGTIEEHAFDNFHVGQKFPIEDRGRIGSTKYIYFTTPLGLRQPFKEAHFAIEVVTKDVQRYRRLYNALEELMECMFEEDPRILESMKTAARYTPFDEALDSVMDRTVQFVNEDCEDQFKDLVSWLR